MKSIRKILLIIFFVWLLTLGIFHERELTGWSLVGGASAWEQFESGSLRMCPYTSVNASPDYDKSRGIPFLVYSTVEHPPYRIDFRFVGDESDSADAIVLEYIEITYDNEIIERVKMPKNGVREVFTLDVMGETVYRSVNFSFPDAVSKHRNCRIKFLGYFESAKGVEQYSGEVDMILEYTDYFSVGWIPFLYRIL